MKYALEIERQNAAIEIHSRAARISIKSNPPSFTVNRTPAKMSIEREAPAFRKAEPSAFVNPPQYTGGDVVELSKRFEGYKKGTDVVNGLADKYAAQQAAENGTQPVGQAQGALTAMRQQQSVNTAKTEAARSSKNEDNMEWDPGYVKMNWEAHSIELKWDVHPLEVEYEPYSVEITMKNYPSIRIRAHAVHQLGRRVDRRI